MFDAAEAETDPSTLKYDILETVVNFSGNVMVDCFFGENIKDEKIEGKGIFQFAKEIMGESMTQRDIFYFLLGLKFINLGIRKKDRMLNRKIAIY